MCPMAQTRELAFVVDASSELQLHPSRSCGLQLDNGDLESLRGCKTRDPPSPTAVSTSSKDAAKKKRVNRAAKLKQCKLDARREQWLAQVAGKVSRSDQQQSQLERCQDDKCIFEGGKKSGLTSLAVKDLVVPVFEEEDKQRFLHLDSPYLSEGRSGVLMPMNPIENLNVPTGIGASRPINHESSTKDSAEPYSICSPDGSSEQTYVVIMDDKHAHQPVEDVLSSGVHNVNKKSPKRGSNEAPFGSSIVSGTDNDEQKPDKGGEKGSATDEMPPERGLMQVPIHDFSTCSSSDTSTSRSNSSSSSSSYGGSGSDDDDDPRQEVDDDWEAVADALHIQASSQQQHSPSKDRMSGDWLNSPLSEGNESLNKKAIILMSSDLQNGVLKPEYKYKTSSFGTRPRGDVGRAWRPDDTSRPPSLPRLSKHHSFPLQSGTPVWGSVQGSVWKPPPAPSYCPICTEELDITDSSFIPCMCGFRLCLFCHHKIALDDGRCPGCRKLYNTDVAAKLTRPSSIRPRI